jgi:putative FmdB family regulatory protein
MPIYEFFCRSCNTLYNFFSSSVDTERRPDCPRCSRPALERRPARFAMRSRSLDARTDDTDEPFAGLDDARMEAAMSAMERELEGIDDDAPDPGQLARALRSLGDAGGIEIGPRMKEIIEKLDAGADPESLESEIAALDDDASFEEFFRLRKKAATVSKKPEVDEELYFF